MVKKSILFFMAELCTAVAFAQSPSAAVPPKPTTPLVDVASAPQLTPKQIQRLLDLQQDWAQLNRYRGENTALPPPRSGERRVVFLGDSITDSWGRGRNHGQFFPSKPYINRGISGQTTPQMLVRFQQDVLSLQPKVVVILAGTNDFAENTGPEPTAAIEDNFRSMVTLAKANHVRVVLSSTLPAARFNWRPGINPSERIKELNAWMEQFCKEQNLIFLNYYPSVVNSDGGMRPELTTDGSVHPNDAGYAIMEPLAEQAIEKSLAQPVP